jgi:hypothetical protein
VVWMKPPWFRPLPGVPAFRPTVGPGGVWPLRSGQTLHMAAVSRADCQGTPVIFIDGTEGSAALEAGPKVPAKW